MIFRTVASLALIVAASPSIAQTRPTPQPLPAPLPPTLPWSGASEKLVAAPGSRWITPAEAARFETTPDYAATRAWIEKLVAASPLLTLESFGTSAEGRDLYFVRARKGAAGKPVLLAQAGIHAGEIDGKDAGMMLLRDIAFGGKDALLDRAELVFVPIFNADGHERSSAWNRPNQRGPREMGWRTTAQNLNLNRDYLKADTPEMRAMLALIRRIDPALYLDLHVTDGTDYQYDITYDYNGLYGRYANSPAIGRWLDQRLRPAMDRALTANGHVPGIYVSALDNRTPEKGITHDADAPRFSTGWGDVARVPTVLLETHSLKPYRQRVLGTYVFVETALRTIGEQGDTLRTAIARDRADLPRETVLAWKRAEKPLFSMDFKGVAYDRYPSPASGRDEIRWLGKPLTQKMPVFGQVPALSVRLPRAWWVPATDPQVIERLDAQGIAYERIDAPRILTLDMVRLTDPRLSAASEGHVPLTAGFRHERRSTTMPAGSVRVPSDQPLGLLAAAMLEAESPDSLLAWNYFPAILTRTEYIEGYAIAPLADRMLARDPALRRAFDAKLAAEPDFAANPNARLQWFYERTPYYDERYLLYPVGREM